MASNVLAPDFVGGETSLARLPMTVGVPVMLFELSSSFGKGRAVLVQSRVVLRQ